MIEFEQFLREANKNGYASGNPGVKTDYGTTLIVYPLEGTRDGWVFRDEFRGGEPYAGWESITKDGINHWSMVYYGSVVAGEDLSVVYPFLQSALTQEAELPVRGPSEFTGGELRYINSLEGKLEKFKGREIIQRGERTIYEAEYMGGLVDQIQE